MGMDTTLIINPGSSSKKYALYRGGREIFNVLYEHTKDGFGKCVAQGNERSTCSTLTEIQFKDALVDTIILATNKGYIQKKTDITRIGVRIVAPGTFFTTHRIVDARYITALREVAVFAPLHIPHQLAELEHIIELFPDTRIIGVSDSAFHVTMPSHARYYSVPRNEAQTLDLYRFGYHGLSVASVVRQVHEYTASTPQKMIVCHVGSGISVTALHNGKSIDTTMGFAPTSGLMMGTRGADIDISAFLYMLKRHENELDFMEKMINMESGLKGLMGSADLRIVLDRYMRGDQFAHTAIQMYIGGVRKAIGSMIAVLGGLDTLILTATAPERNQYVRKLLVQDLQCFGIIFNEKKNEMLHERTGGIISDDSSAVIVRVVHTQEMNEIARIARVF
jgi:acetate kinase